MKKILSFFALLAFVLIIPAAVSAANITAPDQYASFVSLDLNNDSVFDRINFSPTGYGVTVAEDALTGYAWGETVGWINFAPTDYGVTNTCNGDDSMTLGGYAWGQNAGWINFNPQGGGVTISADGEFDGYAWSQNFGWIEFSCPGGNTCVRTSFTCPTESGGGGGGGGGQSYALRVVKKVVNNNQGQKDSSDFSLRIKQGGSTVSGPFSGNESGVTYIASVGSTYQITEDPVQGYSGVFSGDCSASGFVTISSEKYVHTCILTNYDQQIAPGIPGCTNKNALNYNSQANYDDGSCVYPETQNDVLGCTAPTALNYNPLATVNDGSCQYPKGPEDVLGCTRSEAENYNPQATVDNGSCIIKNILGCTDTNAVNYQKIATNNDGSCVYSEDLDQQEKTTFSFLDPVRVFGGDFFKNIDLEMIGATISAIALIGTVANIPFRVTNASLAIPFFRRKRKYWGTVYDSITYEPLDPAYVQVFDMAGNEVVSGITDLDGRYGFLIEPGTYTIKASKTNYSFPSKTKNGQTQDKYYQNLYFGGPITITNQGEVITKDIPMDPTGEDWNQAEKRRMNITRFFKRHDMKIHKIIDILFVIGLAYTIYSLVVNFNTWNLVMLGVYIAMTIITIIGNPARAYGIVKDITGKAAAGSVVRFFNANLNKEMLHRVVGKNGYYYALTQEGDYYATVNDQKPGETEQVIHKTEAFKAPGGVLKKDITIK